MLRSLVFAGLVAAGLIGMAPSMSQAAVLPADGAQATETGAVMPVRYEDPGYRYGYNSNNYYPPYYYYHRPHYRYYRQYPNYGNYYYRPYRPHRFWWRW